MLVDKPVILVDIDDTIGDFAHEFWRIHNQVFQANTDPKSVTNWDISLFSNRGTDAFELFKYPGLFRNLQVKPYAKEFMENIRQFSDVYIVSDTPKGTSYQELYQLENNEHEIEFPHSNPADDKRMWVKDHFPDFPQDNIIFCSCKWMVYGDILVDDKPATFERFRQLGRDVILMDMPHNRDIQTKWRAMNLQQAEEMIVDILEKKGKLASISI